MVSVSNAAQGVTPARGDTAPCADDRAAIAHVRDVVRRSGSSFALGMKVLPERERDAMYAIYAFCREVDDIADEPAPEAEKRAGLAAWRQEVERLYDGGATRLTTEALTGPVKAFDLPKEEFDAIIDGMEMDVGAGVVAPSFEDFHLYCRRVAGAVGLLSVRVFGDARPAAQDFACALGEALQITNILRDLDEDRAMGRLYVPRDLLEKHAIPVTTLDEVLNHQAFPEVCGELVDMARAKYREAQALVARCDRRALRPALIMMAVYEKVLDRLETRGFERLDRPVNVSMPAKLWAVLRHAFF